MNNELQVIKPEGAVATVPSVGAMLQAVIEKGVSTENVAALEQLVKLYERMQDRDAEKLYNVALAALQAEIPNVQAVRAVPNNDGSVRYKFAPFEDIMRQVGPLLQRHGFSISFSNEFTEGRIAAICTISHIGGHKRDYRFAARIGKGPPGSSESQADGSASTYAKRFALCNALNIVISHMDDDARAEGGTITAEQASELEQRVNNTHSDQAAFLKFAAAKSFAEISSVKFEMLDELLSKRERIIMAKMEKGA